MTANSKGRSRMTHLLLLVGVAMLLVHGRVLRAEEGRYSGKANVENVGLVGFPPGQWYLETSRVQKDPDVNRQAREYFVFRRADAEGERLTIVRYNPFLAPNPPADL